jgi:hypothetical protein
MALGTFVTEIYAEGIVNELVIINKIQTFLTNY